jgi:omega-amidase
MVTVALAQMGVDAGQPDATLARARAFAAQAREAGADLLLLPELWLHGYDMERAEEWAAPLGEGGFIQMAQLAREFGVYVGRTLFEQHGGGISNTAVLCAPDGALVGFYRKVHLFRLMQEHRYLIPGDRAKLLPTPWGLAGFCICYDLRFPEFARTMALAGAVLLLVPTQWPAVRLEAWLTLVRARAIENELFIAACNRVGVDGDIIFPGHSCVVDPLGRVLAEGDDQDRLLVIRLDLHEVQAARRYLPVYEDRRRDVYQADISNL